MNYYYLNQINDGVRHRPLEFVHESEHAYTRRLKEIGTKVSESDGHKVLMLAGPSSSGKTTTAIKLAKSIRAAGRRCFVVHLDDFYKNRSEIPGDKDGKKDFEGIQALELGLLQKTLRSLLQTGRAALPEYDFTTGLRRDYVHPIHIRHGDIVIVEGLHALNPQIFEPLENEGNLYKAFVNISSSICDEEKNVQFGPRDIRLLRRMIRDYNYRNSSVVNTFSMWPEVIAGEERNLFPFQNQAEIQIDSFHPYEVCVYKKTAVNLLNRVSQSGPFYAAAENIMDKLENVEPMSSLVVPGSSLLQEFIK